MDYREAKSALRLKVLAEQQHAADELRRRKGASARYDNFAAGYGITLMYLFGVISRANAAADLDNALADARAEDAAKSGSVSDGTETKAYYAGALEAHAFVSREKAGVEAA